MAHYPRFKLYDANNEYLGALKDPANAAVLLANLDPGSTIRDGHRRKDIIFTEGHDGTAALSYDDVAHICYKNIKRRETPQQ